MQQLIDMLREMSGACKTIMKEHPVGYAQAVQNAHRGALPGIRVGIGHGVMLRLVIEKENNDANSVASTAENGAWNSLWIDPSQEGRDEP